MVVNIHDRELGKAVAIFPSFLSPFLGHLSRCTFLLWNWHVPSSESDSESHWPHNPFRNFHPDVRDSFLLLTKSNYICGIGSSRSNCRSWRGSLYLLNLPSIRLPSDDFVFTKPSFILRRRLPFSQFSLMSSSLVRYVFSFMEVAQASASTLICPFRLRVPDVSSERIRSSPRSLFMPSIDVCWLRE